MAKRWTAKEETQYRNELVRLYITQNKPIGVIGIQAPFWNTGVLDK